MSILNRSTRFQGVLVLLSSALCTLALRAEAAVEAPGTSKVWHVQYLNGPISVTKGKNHKVVPLPSGTSLNAKVGPEGIVFRKKKDVLLAIPSAGIDQVTYDRASHRVSKAVADDMANNIQNCGNGDYLCGTVVVTELVVAVVALPFKYTNHYVRISWEEDGAVQVMELKFDKHDYLPLLSELQKATNKPWRNLPEENAAFLRSQKNSRPCQEQALSGDDLLLHIGKASGMQDQLNAAAACRFWLRTIEAAAGGWLMARMQRNETSSGPYQYRVIHAGSASRKQAELNRAGAEGYRLRPGMSRTLGQFGWTVVLVMEKPHGQTPSKYEYLYCKGSSERSARKKAGKASAQGYQQVDQVDQVQGRYYSVALILERPGTTSQENK
ncbi:MAG TPA: hypothetical protein VNM47_05940 [Terriglobia bacterium]|nr:hypothetical protein [Terriglobia bacterium]